MDDFWLGGHTLEDGIMKANDSRKVWVPFEAIPRPADGVAITCLPRTPLVTGSGIKQQRNFQSGWIEVLAAVIARGDILNVIRVEIRGSERR